VKKHTVYDQDCRQIITDTPPASVAWWLMASYLYYHEDQPILSDAMFDELTHFLIERWDDVEHPHKHLISAQDLAAGSGFAISKDHYPAIVIGAAQRLMVEGICVLPEATPTSDNQLSLF